MKHFLLAFVTLFFCTAINAGNVIYAQLSSAIDQQGGQIKAEVVDGLNGMGYNPTTGLQIKKGGKYLVVLAPQTGSVEGCGDYWLQVNLEDVENSNIRVCQTDQLQTTVAVSQGVIEVDKGDRITFMQSGSVGIEAVQPAGEPLIPSVIISVFKL